MALHEAYSSRTRRHLAVLLLTLIAAGALAVGYLVDPMDGGAGSLLPHCPLKWLTGYDCPGCGTTRALHALTHGRFAEAWQANPFMAVSMPAIAAAAAIEVAPPGRLDRLRNAILSPAAISIYIAATLGWWLLRNLIY